MPATLEEFSQAHPGRRTREKRYPFWFGGGHEQGINNEATMKPEHRCSEILMVDQPLPIVDYLFDDRDRGEYISEMNVALTHDMKKSRANA